MKTLLKKVASKLRKDTVYEFVPIEEEKVSPEARKFIEKLTLVGFLTHSNTFTLKVDPRVRESLNRYFTKKFVYRQSTTPEVYLFGEPGKKMTFTPLGGNEVKLVRESGTPFVAIEIFKGEDFNKAYLNTLLKNLRKEIKNLPIEVQKKLDLDEHPLRRDVLTKGLKSLTKEEVQYIKALKNAVEATPLQFLKDLAIFAKTVFENISNLKKGKAPQELYTFEKAFFPKGKIGEELLKHSATTVTAIYSLIKDNANLTQDFMKNILEFSKHEETTLRGPSL